MSMKHCGDIKIKISDKDISTKDYPYVQEVMNELQPGNFFGEQMNSYIEKIECILQQDIPIDKKYETLRPVIISLYQILWKRKQFVKDKVFWEELYHKYTYFYKFLNAHPIYGNVGNIPVVKVTKHNDAPWYWMNIMKNNNLKTLGQVMHVDTHADSNDIQYPEKLREIGKRIMNGQATNKDWKLFRTLSWDIGAAVTSYQIMTKTEAWFWIVPSWIKHREGDFEVVQAIFNTKAKLRSSDPSMLEQMYDKKDKLVSTRFFGISGQKKPNDGPDVQTIRVPKREEDIADGILDGKPSSRFKEVFKALEPAVFKLRKPNGDRGKWKKIGHELSDKYILDIDLDYFCSNGIDFFKTDEYKKWSYDVYSTGRTNVPDFTMYPRAMNDPKRNNKIAKFTEKTKSEVKLILKRIDEFIVGIKILKGMGKIPSVISISDSTGVNFQDTEYFSFSNEYLPRYYALFVHMIIIDKLKEIFV